jgi:hypothetical protein
LLLCSSGPVRGDAQAAILVGGAAAEPVDLAAVADEEVARHWRLDEVAATVCR